ncbi:tripartite tricarboxylate transporter TctB family protein [Paracoccus sp. XHP0099]|uniref:Tripartite tricarboxylate transporter TctB family protein n=2 Tax=Paracoccus marinaquae TaxID=2841926 RepID=A0ABS6AFK4_9RHOB|nr:tripartite tricarboxylate transporter TctB family protein [Paracoccus marinaquae]
MIVLALGYILSASQIEDSFMTDPVGPRIFPYIIATVMILCSVAMILRPDPDAEWPAGPMLAQLGLALLVLIGYAYAITPVGFIIPTAIASGVLSWQIGGRPARAAITGIGLGIGLWVLFRLVLGLGLRGLPAGWGI